MATEKNKYDGGSSEGNDMSDGDARDEPRTDKDTDLKTGNDESSPLAVEFDKDEKDKKKAAANDRQK